MTTFGETLRNYRMRAGLGLRTFASLINERASVVSAVESGQRSPWRDSLTLERAAEVLGCEWDTKLLSGSPSAEVDSPRGNVCWWEETQGAPAPDWAACQELAEFVGASLENVHEENVSSLATLTELAIEWRVRQLLGRRTTQVAAAPVDVEAVLENEAGVRIEIVPGLIPRFSVQACVVTTPTGLTIFVDRITADSKPIASYRHLLARCFAPALLWQADKWCNSEMYLRMPSSETWPQWGRGCERFALAVLLPADPVVAAVGGAYQELHQQSEQINIDDACRAVRNRLAEQFAVPTSLVDRRLEGWPCHVYDRIARALAAEEPTLPPLDWLVEHELPRQQMLFELGASNS